MNSRGSLFRDAREAYNKGDFNTALRLMEACAEGGDPVACFSAALWCSGGEVGFPVDPARSKYWLGKLEALAEDGNSEAQWELGQNLRFGNLVRQDIELANHWLERSAASGYAEAQHQLAWYLETGQYGYPIDAEAANSWYDRTFEQEHPETLYVYAIRRFIDGRPSEEALQLLRKAADKGFQPARDIFSSYLH